MGQNRDYISRWHWDCVAHTPQPAHGALDSVRTQYSSPVRGAEQLQLLLKRRHLSAVHHNTAQPSLHLPQHGARRGAERMLGLSSRTLTTLSRHNLGLLAGVHRRTSTLIAGNKSRAFNILSRAMEQQQALKQRDQEPKDVERRKAPSNDRRKHYKADSPEVRISKTLSWILRHASESLELPMRPDGYVRVDELVSVTYY